MTVLALDLGTTTGWCCGKPRQIISGTWDLRPRRFDGGGMRYLRFREMLGHMIVPELERPKLVVFEEVRRHAGTDAAHVYGGLLATLTSWCEEHGIPYEGVPVQTIKRFATGKGNGGKNAVLAAVRSWGFSPIDDNEADAIALWHYRVANMVEG